MQDMVPRNTNTPFLNVRDKQTNKQFSLKPIKAFKNIDQILLVSSVN